MQEAIIKVFTVKKTEQRFFLTFTSPTNVKFLLVLFNNDLLLDT